MMVVIRCMTSVTRQGEKKGVEILRLRIISQSSACLKYAPISNAVLFLQLEVGTVSILISAPYSHI